MTHMTSITYWSCNQRDLWCLRDSLCGAVMAEGTKKSSKIRLLPDPGFVSVSRWGDYKNWDGTRPTSLRLWEQSPKILEVMCELLRILFPFATVSMLERQMAQRRAVSVMPLLNVSGSHGGERLRGFCKDRAVGEVRSCDVCCRWEARHSGRILTFVICL